MGRTEGESFVSDYPLEHFPIIPDHIRQRQSSFGIQLA